MNKTFSKWLPLCAVVKCPRVAVLGGQCFEHCDVRIENDERIKHANLRLVESRSYFEALRDQLSEIDVRNGGNVEHLERLKLLKHYPHGGHKGFVDSIEADCATYLLHMQRKRMRLDTAHPLRLDADVDADETAANSALGRIASAVDAYKASLRKRLDVLRSDVESKRRCVDEAIQKKTSDAEHWQWIQDQAIAFTRNRAATLIQRAWLHAKYRPGGSGMIDVVTKCYERASS